MISMKHSQNPAKQIMAFDYGTKHIGIATGQMLTQSAQGLSQIKATNGLPDWQALDTIVLEWKPTLFIVGLPLNMDDSESHMSKRATKFSNRLTDRYHIPCVLVDERLSSQEVKSGLMEDAYLSKKQKKPKEIDSLAAAVILESWLRAQEC